MKKFFLVVGFPIRAIIASVFLVFGCLIIPGDYEGIKDIALNILKGVV